MKGMSIEKSKENLMQPSKEFMLKHLKFITDGMDDYCDGRIEVGGLFHTNTNNYTINDLESACDKALSLNKNNNVYCVGSFLDPDILPSGRSNDEDFYATNVLWCDIDAEHDPEQLKELYRDCPPNRAVVTARVPHRRIHLWWKLDEPIVDPDTLREALRGIANKLGGDTMVTNPTSLMRLAGSVNYPTQKKKDESGRVNELTEYIEIHDNKVSIDKILRIYPDSGAPIIKTDNVVNINSTVKPVNVFDSRLTDGRDKYMSDMVLAAIYNLTRDLNRLPTAQEVFDDAWPVYSVKVVSRSQKGLDAEGRGQKAMMQKINSKLRAFQSGRFGSVEEVIKSNSEKTKRTTLLLNQNNQDVNDEIIDPETGEVIDENPIRAINISELDLDNIPTRKWLFGDIAARKYVTMISASPGAGKSLLTMQMGMCASYNKNLGEYTPQEENIKTWIYNNEEGEEELRRRAKAIIINEGFEPEKLHDKFYLNSGEQRSICIAKKTLDNGDVLHTPDYDQLKKEVEEKGIDMLIIDPFAETHAVNENSNDEIKQVVSLYRKIAFECNCAVVLVSHTRKGSSGVNSSNTHGNPDDVRGGGAQVGVVRRVFTLAKMDTQTAAKMQVPDDQKKWFVRFDDGKTNITAPADKATWFKLKSVYLKNSPNTLNDGDSVGVLEYKTPDDIRKMYSESFKTERNLLMTKLAYRMIERNIDELTINQSSELLIENKDTDKGDRSLRKELKLIGENIDDIGNIISEGYRCYFSYVQSETKSKGNIFVLKRHEI